MKRFALLHSVVGFALVALAGLMLVNCGEKTEFPNDLPDPVYGGVDTSYVVITPTWTEFNGLPLNNPGDVYIGYDQFIYICDSNNDRVLKCALDGTVIQEYPVVHPEAITQDRGLDLLVVCGNYSRNEIIDDVDSVMWYGDALFRQRYRGNQPFTKVFQAPYPYFLFNDHPQHAQFWSVEASTLPTKDYYLTDFWLARIIEFNSSDEVVAEHLAGLSGKGSTTYPCDLRMYEIADQNYVALAQAAPTLGVQLFSFPDWAMLHRDIDTLPPMIRFQSRTYKDIAVDELSNFYLLLSEPDPILGADYYFYKYDRRGELLMAFGALGSGDLQFRDPRGIAYFEGIIYVADSGNNRILRYQLTTEIRQ